MPKNIVILLDGTSNEISSNRTNILRLYGTLSKSETQLVYYDPGVGTFGAENSVSQIYRKAIELRGMATGWGLDANVKEAYRFLVDNYQKTPDGERDRIFIFGFSRGAYTARVLAGFIHAFGLMEPRNLNLLHYVYRAYKGIGQNPKEGAFDELNLYERTLRPDNPSIEFLGLFDTVSSVIERSRIGFSWRQQAFTMSNTSVKKVRHAVAIEERRLMFRPQLWPEDQMFRPSKFSENGAVPQDAREVWFAGVHGDIGGGYPEPESALAKIPLHWMIRESQGEGLLDYKTRTVNRIVLGKDGKYAAPDNMGQLHNSMNWGWRILEGFGDGKPRDFSARPIIHESAMKRYASMGRPPPNLPADYLLEPDDT